MFVVDHAILSNQEIQKFSKFVVYHMQIKCEEASNKIIFKLCMSLICFMNYYSLVVACM